jgi:uncharacterized SAM-binding protein YcdF (DUF218 family)
MLRLLLGVIDIPRPLRYVPDCPKIVFKIPNRMSINYLIWSFTQPSHILVLIFLAGVVSAFFKRPRLSKRLLLSGATAVLVITYTPLGKWAIAPLELRFPAPSELADVDGIILLAGSEQVTRSIYYNEPHLNSHASRFTAFFLLAERFPTARLVHSGGGKLLEQHGGSASQQSIATEILAATAITLGRMIFEPDAANTCDTPRLVKTIVQPRPGDHWVVVTSAHHMPRTIACFRAEQWHVTPYPGDFKQIPVGFGLPSLAGNLRLLDDATHEWLGLIYYRLLGYTDEIFPAPKSAMLAAPD